MLFSYFLVMLQVWPPNDEFTKTYQHYFEKDYIYKTYIRLIALAVVKPFSFVGPRYKTKK